MKTSDETSEKKGSLDGEFRAKLIETNPHVTASLQCTTLG